MSYFSFSNSCIGTFYVISLDSSIVLFSKSRLLLLYNLSVRSPIELIKPLIMLNPLRETRRIISRIGCKIVQIVRSTFSICYVFWGVNEKRPQLSCLSISHHLDHFKNRSTMMLVLWFNNKSSISLISQIKIYPPTESQFTSYLCSILSSLYDWIKMVAQERQADCTSFFDVWYCDKSPLLNHISN